jgi:trans-aconitate methyltransferase
MTESHWESVHATKGTEVSWWQPADTLWIDIVDDLTLDPTVPVVDVGSGSSLFVDALVGAGFQDVTAVDVSATALDGIKARIGDRAQYVVTDIRDFVSASRVGLWHDRAVFHFLVDAADQQRYGRNLRASLAADGYAIIATFAPDGPDSCSGLPVQRWAAADLAQALGLTLVRAEHRIHTTPWNSRQPFTIAVLRS